MAKAMGNSKILKQQLIELPLTLVRGLQTIIQFLPTPTLPASKEGGEQ